MARQQVLPSVQVSLRACGMAPLSFAPWPAPTNQHISLLFARRLSECHKPMCIAEWIAFARWAASRGGLERPKRAAEYAHRSHMHSTWRNSREFKAWLLQHSSDCDGEFIACGPNPEVATESHFSKNPSSCMCGRSWPDRPDHWLASLDPSLAPKCPCPRF